MLDAAAIIAQLKAAAPGLRSVEGALELQALMDAKTPMAAGKPFAHVVPLGLRGGRAEAATGMFLQDVTATFGVFLTIPAPGGAATGSKVVGQIEPVVVEVLDALAGWGPEDSPGVLILTRAALQNFRPGAAVYVIEFALADQLRITR